MYALPYGTSDVEPRHYKLEWLSLLGAVAAALALLLVAYFINHQDGLQKVAFICIVVAGFTVALCLAALLAHFYVAKQPPKEDCDAPPSYKDAWRTAFYSRRVTEIQDPEDNGSSATSTLVPHSNPELQCGSLPKVSLGSSAHISPCTPDFPTHSLHTTATPASSSSACRNHHITSCSHHCFNESQVTENNDPPSYDEAMQSMDLSSLQKLRCDTDVEDDQ